MGMETSGLKALIVHGIAAKFPMENLHYPAGLANKYINRTVGWIKASLTHLATETIDTHAHVCGMTGNYNTVAFTDVEHNRFLDAKFNF